MDAFLVVARFVHQYGSSTRLALSLFAHARCIAGLSVEMLVWIVSLADFHDRQRSNRAA